MTAHKDNAVNTSTTASSAAEQPGIFSRMGRTITRFLREVMAELKKTNWPNRNELTKFTIVVMVTIIVVAVFLFVGDFVFARIADQLFHIGPPPGQ